MDRNHRTFTLPAEKRLRNFGFSRCGWNGAPGLALRIYEGFGVLLSAANRSCSSLGMSSSANKVSQARAVDLSITADTLSVSLADGRTITVPLRWYPRLEHGTPAEQGRWELIGTGVGIHWPDLDEDISVESLLQGHASNESAVSIDRALAGRDTRKP